MIDNRESLKPRVIQNLFRVSCLTRLISCMRYNLINRKFEIQMEIDYIRISNSQKNNSRAKFMVL